jgi:hypothetical protein
MRYRSLSLIGHAVEMHLNVRRFVNPQGDYYNGSFAHCDSARPGAVRRPPGRGNLRPALQLARSLARSPAAAFRSPGSRAALNEGLARADCGHPRAQAQTDINRLVSLARIFPRLSLACRSPTMATNKEESSAKSVFRRLREIHALLMVLTWTRVSDGCARAKSVTDGSINCEGKLFAPCSRDREF